MTSELGQRLRIRSLVYVAGEQIPYFWPMRAFIHHNPLHGFEDRNFAEAVREGTALFHARGYLAREQYQRYLAQGRIDRDHLRREIAAFVEDDGDILGRPVLDWALVDLTDEPEPVGWGDTRVIGAEDLAALLQGRPLPARPLRREALRQELEARFLSGMPLYEVLDALFGTELGAELDELVIKSCLDFFDEGQSVWGMPEREQGFFRAWRAVALRNGRLFLKGLHLREVMGEADAPEQVIAQVMSRLGIPELLWQDYLRREIARLHGWAGFIRWRSSAAHYHWAQRYPADLVDYVAVRLLFSAALLREASRRGLPADYPALRAWMRAEPEALFLREELYGRHAVPALAGRVERTLLLGRRPGIEALFAEYMGHKRELEARAVGARLTSLGERLGVAAALSRLPAAELDRLLRALDRVERNEGQCWLRAMEAHAIDRLVAGVTPDARERREKRPFAQALFCIDTRSERIRRQLEAAGDYQTFGIAGFFGVPLSFIEIGKGSETHLCPVLLTPRNLVVEIPGFEYRDEAAVTALGKVVHELKESILTPFVTVEAIGLLFGFDMIGKTLFPALYGPWRKRLAPRRGITRLLVDKLSRERADSIVRAVQRAVIEKAVEQDFGLRPEHITDDMVRTLREAAMGKAEVDRAALAALGLDDDGVADLVERLREVYLINPAFVRVQMERLGRIGFTVDEQAGYVATALRSIGLTSGFSRFVLLVGHGSTSENNPYESALDCGACGGNHGLVNARVLAQMANSPQVRRRLRRQGIDIPDDTWFMPALHDTTTDEIRLEDVELIPPAHLIYIERLRNGLISAARLCAAERVPTLAREPGADDPARAWRIARRNALDWSQVRPEWGLSGNAYFIIGRRAITRELPLHGRAFLHSYDYRLDPRRRLLENILTGPLVVGQWINMEHYFSTVDNERFGSGSKVYHNVAGRFGVMTGNLSDLRTGLPAQTVLRDGMPYHEPMRLITLVEAPLAHARLALEEVASVKRLVHNEWIRFLVVDREAGKVWEFDRGDWLQRPGPEGGRPGESVEAASS